MSWHFFVLVWGDEFVDRFGKFVVPFLAMPGNIPALANDGDVVFHAYTDASSRSSLEAALAPLAALCRIDVRLFDDSAAQRFSGPNFRYELQRGCLRDLVASLSDGSIVLLDSNFLLSDGTLAAVSERRRQGYSAACITFVRTSTESLLARLMPSLSSGAAIGGGPLLDLALSSLHHITRSFFVDAAPFTPYPSQVSWRIGTDGFVTRNFLPHPLMVPVSSALLHSQSTMDYDLALRLAPDDQIYVGNDSGEMLVVKFSGDDHQSDRNGSFAPTAEDLGLFLLTCTNRRHRVFADVAAAFHCGTRDARYQDAAVASQALIDDAYAWIDRLATQSGRLDARLLMYLKSHLGPIEDFMSPQLEPAALARLPGS
jgi:hypothetical protein